MENSKKKTKKKTKFAYTEIIFAFTCGTRFSFTFQASKKYWSVSGKSRSQAVIDLY